MNAIKTANEIANYLRSKAQKNESVAILRWNVTTQISLSTPQNEILNVYLIEAQNKIYFQIEEETLNASNDLTLINLCIDSELLKARKKQASFWEKIF